MVDVVDQSSGVCTTEEQAAMRAQLDDVHSFLRAAKRWPQNRTPVSPARGQENGRDTHWQSRPFSVCSAETDGGQNRQQYRLQFV